MNSASLVQDRQTYLFGSLFPHSISLKVSGRQDGNMSCMYGDTGTSLENRRRFLRDSGIDSSRLVCCRQVHGDTVRRVTAADAGSGALDPATSIPDTDALITSQRRVPLTIFTADCLAVFLYDAQKQVIGLVHAGWRGTEQNITGKTIQAMMEQYDCLPEDIYAGFGPAIRSCCYQVGEEFSGRFKHGVINRDNSYFLDLIRINTDQLVRREIKRENIIDSSLCTACNNDEYFSYRKEGDSCGRAMAVLMIR